MEKQMGPQGLIYPTGGRVLSTEVRNAARCKAELWTDICPDRELCLVMQRSHVRCREL